MKKSVLFGVLIIFLMFSISFILAQDEETVDDKAYACLEGKVKNKCTSLSPEGKIFSLLALGECKNEVLSDSNYESDIKLTAQAILGLDETGVDTSDAEEWLLSQNDTFKGILWYLEIEEIEKSVESITCSITYSGGSTDVSFGEDKKISSISASTCLSRSTGSIADYWLKIDSDCYDKEFEISCDKSFLTTLLFKRTTSSTIHVSEKMSSASPGGTTTEKVNSFCFEQGNSCDYEGSLWATLVLDYLGYEVSSYLPYLITMAGETENLKYLPEAFLCFLTDDFCSELLNKQKESKLWMESGDKFYDTALALYPFQYDELQEKTNAINWLEEVQGEDGCWGGGNVRNTAFILYSIWPKKVTTGGNGVPEEEDCEEDAGYYCMSAMSCQEAEGDELDYYCFPPYICCDRKQVLETCTDQGGEICDSDETCVGGTTLDAPDLEYGEVCCVGGECEIPEDEPECEIYGGDCRSSCFTDEEEGERECFGNDVCCIEKITPPRNYLAIIILSVLIVLVVVGIVFRKKLKALLSKFKSRRGKSRRGPGRPRPPGMGPRGFPPSRPGPPRRVMPRRILPSSAQRIRQPVSRPALKPKGDLDKVLKKLKDMGK